MKIRFSLQNESFLTHRKNFQEFFSLFVVLFSNLLFQVFPNYFTQTFSYWYAKVIQKVIIELKTTILYLVTCPASMSVNLSISIGMTIMSQESGGVMEGIQWYTQYTCWIILRNTEYHLFLKLLLINFL